MDLRHLDSFVAVAEESSFSRAADRLHVVQSAVSATIRNLEREWGVTLFHRTTHRVELSPEGRALLPSARAALQAAAAVGHAVDEVRGGLRGTIRLGIMQATQGAGGISVAATIAAFAAEHPGVTVEVRQGGSADQAERVRTGELDLSFLGLPDRDLPGLDVTVLAEPAMVLVCHVGHRLAERGAVELKDLAGEPFCDLPPAWGVRVANDRAFAAAGLPHELAYEINDLATIADFVAHGLAITITLEMMLAPGVPLARVPIRRGPRLAVAIAAPAQRPSSPAARAFVTMARRHALVDGPAH
ncbi:MAG TPA: LysR family transcriptional regulator [Baekduia sp.]|uniref:LysR family transcriptional regulator n=1 Tax=Baekduia sp. TaxID=2600305 RepID=UPI002D775A0C|nr:LysR family transcriptional regulator [Baekduia sp.]HET6510207.1 LysR family transcriptional regulator [Baekduia sp.]